MTQKKEPLSFADPIPLPELVWPVEAFSFELLPPTLRPWVKDIADRIQCPPDFPAVAAMVALAAVVGRRIGIRPQCKTDWLVVPNLWGCVVGRPGIMKTPAIAEPLKPLQRLEIDAKEAYRRAMIQWNAEEMVNDAKSSNIKNEIKAALREDKADLATEIARKSVSGESAQPTRTRFLVNDATVEKLGEILNQNPGGHILNYRDELAGWIVGLDKDNQEQARSFFLEAWNGTGRFTYDRIGRGTIDIEAACISILGGIQPAVLQKHLGAKSKSATDDGLIQRFQLMVWPDVSKDWKLVDQWPNKKYRDDAYQVYFDLAKLDPSNLEAKFEDDEIPYLRFTPTGQVCFDEWRGLLEQQVRSGNEAPEMESHLSKYRSLIPTLSLLDHLTMRKTGPVGHASVERAIAWAKYLESHARRVYGTSCLDRFTPARDLAKRISSGKVTTPFASRDIYRHGWTGLDDALTVENACRILEDYNWLVMERQNTSGRTATVYHIHPKLVVET